MTDASLSPEGGWSHKAAPQLMETKNKVKIRAYKKDFIYYEVSSSQRRSCFCCFIDKKGITGLDDRVEAASRDDNITSADEHYTWCWHFYCCPDRVGTASRDDSVLFVNKLLKKKDHDDELPQCDELSQYVEFNESCLQTVLLPWNNGEESKSERLLKVMKCLQRSPDTNGLKVNWKGIQHFPNFINLLETVPGIKPNSLNSVTEIKKCFVKLNIEFEPELANCESDIMIKFIIEELPAKYQVCQHALNLSFGQIFPKIFVQLI